MRAVPFVLLVVAAWMVGSEVPEAEARPPFARREGKACGYCHIQPQGGGPRNSRGVAYARNEYKFPARAASLKDFENKRHREKMVQARKLLALDHTRAAATTLRRLAKAVKKDPGAQKAVESELHDLAVKGAEILGQARRFLRSRKEKDHAAGVALLVLLTAEFKGFDVESDAKGDLKDIRKDKTLREIAKRELGESKARLLLLDGQAAQAGGDKKKARQRWEQLLKKYPKSRAAKPARKLLPKPPPEVQTDGNK